MAKYGLFDIIGPVMVGPSSSHTAGAARLGYLAGRFIGGPPEKVTFYLHGSFAATGAGHGTDKALLAGVMGLLPDDDRLPLAFEIAKAKGLSFRFIHTDLGDVHPNTVKIVMENNLEKVEISGSSVGGGVVRIFEVNGIPVEIGENPALIILHQDKIGMLSAIIGLLSGAGYNIATLQCYRKERYGSAITVVVTDEKITPEVREKISRLPFIGKAFAIGTEN